MDNEAKKKSHPNATTEQVKEGRLRIGETRVVRLRSGLTAGLLPASHNQGGGEGGLPRGQG